jgi:hypothetical protein
MTFNTKRLCVFVILLTGALVIPVTATVSDSQEPGSVLVFPLFEVAPGGATAPTTAFEISITPCNLGNTTDPCDTVEHPEDLNLRAHWVCPAVPFQNLSRQLRGWQTAP